jgi:hypothetical protein
LRYGWVGTGAARPSLVSTSRTISRS